MGITDRKYNIELDVLRVLSCVAVLLYHLGFLKGGYLAVCTFFVMSAFLSCRSAFAQERFNILKYYVRRFLHIYLPLAVVVFVTVLIVTALPQIRWLNLKPETTSVLLGYNNYWQLSASMDYFARHVESPFIHFWYIAIQLQFDIVFPILFVVLKWLKKLSVALPCALLVMGSAVSMLWFFTLGTKGQVMEAYYSTAARCFALLLGLLMGFYQSECAPFSFKFERKPAVARTFFCIWLAVWCGLIYVADAASEYFPHVMLAFTIVSMRLIDMAALCGERVPGAFGRYMRGLAGVSYEIYLLQYPVIFLAQELVPASFDPALKYILMIALILLLSAVLHFATGFRPFSGKGRKAKAAQAAQQRNITPAEKTVPPAAEYTTGQVQAAADLVQNGSAKVLDSANTSLAALRMVPDAADYSGASQSVPAKASSGSVSGASRAQKNSGKRRVIKKRRAVFAMRLVVLLAVLAVSGLGAQRFYKAEDHTAELAAMEEMMEENAAMMAERQKEFAERQAQEAADWEAALADFDSGEEKIKETVAKLPIVGLGDSVMLGAVPALYETFPNGYFDAGVSRSAWVVRRTLPELEEQGITFDAIVLNFGANGDCPDEEKERIMEELSGKQVYWLTNTWPKTLYVNDKIKELAQRYDNLTVLDWKAASEGHDEYFYTDGLHLTGAGRTAFASFIYDAIYQDRLAEWQAARDEFIRSHEAAREKTLAFYGDHALLGVYDQLRQASGSGQSADDNSQIAADISAALFTASEDYSIDTLSADLAKAAEAGTLANRVVLVFSKSLIDDASDVSKALSQLAAQYPEHQFYIIHLNVPAGTTLLMADGIHLTQKANAALAETITEALK